MPNTLPKLGRLVVWLGIVFLLSPAGCGRPSPPSGELIRCGAVPVVMAAAGMTRGGQPYFVKGAGGSGNMKELAARGRSPAGLEQYETREPGIYRLYVWVKDGKGHAATATAPFEVK